MDRVGRGAGRIALMLGIGLAAVAIAVPAAAQPWGRYWGGYYYGPGYAPYYQPGYAYGPRVYEEPDEPPPGAPGDDQPQTAPNRQRAPVSLARIEKQVEAQGLRLVAQPRHNGRIYLAVAEDRRGQRHRLIFDAFGGNLIENTVLPRPKPPAKPAAASDAAHPLPSETTKSPTDLTKKATSAPEPAEAKAKPTDPLAIPKGPDAPPPHPPAPPHQPMRRNKRGSRMRSLSLSMAVLTALAAFAGAAAAAPRNEAYDALIQRFATLHGVPPTLVHRIISRESAYNAALTNRHRYFGLMQISYATARSMGYTGTPVGLLDPAVNLTYAVPYLANAYRAADGNEARAVALYAGGYYNIAKCRHMLSELRTATTAALDADKPAEPAPEAAPAEPADNPFARLLRFLSDGPAPAAAATADAAPN